jgi:hypothetical protein
MRRNNKGYAKIFEGVCKFEKKGMMINIHLIYLAVGY